MIWQEKMIFNDFAFVTIGRNDELLVHKQQICAYNKKLCQNNEQIQQSKNSKIFIIEMSNDQETLGLKIGDIGRETETHS